MDNSQQLDDYLSQFKETVLALDNLHPGWWDDEGIPPHSVDVIHSTLAAILEGTRCHKFLKPGLIFRSTINAALKDNLSNMGTIFDLRTESDAVTRALPSKVPTLSIDVILCGGHKEGNFTFTKATKLEYKLRYIPPGVLPTYPWLVQSGRVGLGLLFRCLTKATLPVLLVSSDDLDQAGVVLTLLIWLCGESKRSACDRFLSRHDDYDVEINRSLDEIGVEPVHYFHSMGLTSAEINILLAIFQSLVTPTAPAGSPHTPSYQIIDGMPPTPCRPFLQTEVEALKYYLMAGVPRQQTHPTAVFLTGLPGSGKSTLTSRLLDDVGLRLSECVDVDMDLARSFHCQYQSYRHQTSEESSTLTSYSGLIPWLVAGPTNLEELIYQSQDSVYRTLMDARCHLVVPGVMHTDDTMRLLRYCVERGYRLCLMGVHVRVETALERVLVRARTTGRHTPELLVVDRDNRVKAWFTTAGSYVKELGGDVLLYDNEFEDCVCVFRCVCGRTDVTDPDVAALYLPSEVIYCEADEYNRNGYIALRSCLDGSLMSALGESFEKNISRFAADNGLTRRDYLSVVNKWSHCNTSVMDIMTTIAPLLRHRVAQVLRSSVAWPVGAVLFRKAYSPTASSDHHHDENDDAGHVITHPHQDISYARFPGSQMFRATTWVPLLLCHGDTLAFAPGSHRGGIWGVADFLAPSHTANPTPLPDCSDVIPVTLGDCLLFDARTFHCSTPLTPPSSGGRVLRLAVGIQWLTPGGLDGLVPGAYHRYPSRDLPPQVDVESMQRRGQFSIDTAGYFLTRALRTFAAEITVTIDDRSTVQMATCVTDRANDEVVCKRLQELGCDAEAVLTSLRRYVLFRSAGVKHFGEAQGTRVFSPLHEQFIKRILREEMEGERAVIV